MDSLRKSLSINKAIENDEKKFYRKNSNIPKEYWEYKWAKTCEGDKFYDPNFSTQSKKISEKTIENRIKAKELALAYVKNLEENVSSGKSLLFIGGKDSGKTVLATLILREIINSLLGDVLFVPFSQLVVESNVYYPQDVGNFTEKYINPLALCIDDIDSRSTSDKAKEYIDHILTSRKLSQSPTILTATGDLREIRKTCGDPIYRLLSDSQTYKIFSISSFDEQNFGIDYLYSGHSVNIDLLVSELKKHKALHGNKIDVGELQAVLGRAIYNG